MTLMTRQFSLVIQLAESLDGGRLQRGLQREGLPMEHGAAVRWLQTHCPQPLSLSFSLGESTCNIPCRGNTVNFTTKLLKLIFSGYGIAAALLQVLKYLNVTILAVSGFPNYETRDMLNLAERAEEVVRVIFNHISSDHRR